VEPVALVAVAAPAATVAVAVLARLVKATQVVMLWAESLLRGTPVAVAALEKLEKTAYKVEATASAVAALA
jgi:hypothetical protein